MVAPALPPHPTPESPNPCLPKRAPDAAARRAREAEALRENLRRRKAAAMPKDPEPGACR